MGSGKTTVGQMLASRLSLPFYDTDLIIEKTAGMPVSQIFETLGEGAFRRLEIELIDQWSISEGIVATGGGLPCHHNLLQRLHLLGKTCYLECSPEILEIRLRTSKERPLLEGLVEVQRIQTLQYLLESRKDVYVKASFCVNGAFIPTTVTNSILKKLDECLP